MGGKITDKQRTPHWHESGHRCSSHDSTFADIRKRGVKSGGGHEGYNRCRTANYRGSWRRAHRDDARCGAKRSDKTSGHLQTKFQTCLSRRSRGHDHHRLQWRAASIQVDMESRVLVLKAWRLWRWHTWHNRHRSHTFQWKSIRKVSFQGGRGTTRDAVLAKSRIIRIHSWMSRLRRPQLQTLVEMPAETLSTAFLFVEQFT